MELTNNTNNTNIHNIVMSPAIAKGFQGEKKPNNKSRKQGNDPLALVREGAAQKTDFISHSTKIRFNR
jgi:hypothetical protein